MNQVEIGRKQVSGQKKEEPNTSFNLLKVQ